MERELLDGYLKRGLSLEQIGALVGRDASTVGYWVRKHELRATHVDRHAPRGGIRREVLQHLVDEGLSMRKIADRVGMSQSTVRHWLRQYGLRTTHQPGGRPTGDRASDPGRRALECPRHGITEFWLEKRGTYRCLRCRSAAVSKRRRRLKAILVEEAGGRCERCGYDRCVAALHFHHRDGRTKSFGLADRGYTRSLEVVRREAAKCMLLCSNCHAEVELGMVGDR
jgi:transposase